MNIYRKQMSLKVFCSHLNALYGVIGFILSFERFKELLYFTHVLWGYIAHGNPKRASIVHSIIL